MARPVNRQRPAGWSPSWRAGQSPGIVTVAHKSRGSTRPLRLGGMAIAFAIRFRRERAAGQATENTR